MAFVVGNQSPQDLRHYATKRQEGNLVDEVSSKRCDTSFVQEGAMQKKMTRAGEILPQYNVLKLCAK